MWFTDAHFDFLLKTFIRQARDFVVMRAVHHSSNVKTFNELKMSTHSNLITDDL